MTRPYFIATPEGKETVWPPSGDDPLATLLRSYAVSIWEHERELRRARLEHRFKPVVFFPPGPEFRDVTSGTVVGVQWRVMEGIDSPIFTYELTRRDIS